jgi:hypothetical protein
MGGIGSTALLSSRNPGFVRALRSVRAGWDADPGGTSCRSSATLATFRPTIEVTAPTGVQARLPLWGRDAQPVESRAALIVG